MSMSAKEAVTHIVSILPETLGFEEIIEALAMIYHERLAVEVETETGDAIPDTCPKVAA